MAKLTPLYDKVIILPDPPEEKMGVVLISESARRPPSRGTVVAAGPGVPEMKTTVKANDVVVYPPSCGDPLSIDGVEYLVMRESDIMSIIEKD
mgnify:CR=1 FL=1